MLKDLITPKDIKAIEQKALNGCITADESSLLISANWSEHQIQVACKKAFESEFGKYGIFLKIDNGRNHDRPTTEEQEQNPLWAKAKLHRIHKAIKYQRAEGEQPGFKDVIMIVFGKRGAKNFYTEFKKIGGKIEETQQYWHDFLKSKEESAYFCNNLVYFERVILKEIREFLGMV